MTPPVQWITYGFETPIDISINQYRLIDSLKDKFHVKEENMEEVNSFICLNNNINNLFMNILIDISNRIHSINPSINLGLEIINGEYYFDELLKISVKINDFEDSYKIEELKDQLEDNYSFEFLDKIIISMEF